MDILCVVFMCLDCLFESFRVHVHSNIEIPCFHGSLKINFQISEINFLLVHNSDVFHDLYL